MQQPRLGTRKLHHILNGRPDTALHIGRDRLFTVLRQAGLLVCPARAYHKTTHSHHRFYRHPNLLKAGPEQVIISGPEQVWVADITWLPVRTGTAYVSLVTDAFSRKIVGYHVHESLHYRARGKSAADGAEAQAWQDAADPSLLSGNTVLLIAVPVGA